MDIKVIFHHLSVETLLFSKSISTDTSNNRDGVMVESSWTSFDLQRKKKETVFGDFYDSGLCRLLDLVNKCERLGRF